MSSSQIQISACPNCQNQLEIRRLECSSCGLGLDGHFAKDDLFNLNADDRRFVHLFLRCEGSIRGMEKALGVSYPTVKARLAQVNERLGATPDGTKAEAPSVLDRLNDGDIDFETALNTIKGGGTHARRD